MDAIEEKDKSKNLAFAILWGVALYIIFFAVEIASSIKSLNIVVSADKAFAISGLIMIAYFLVIETLAKYKAAICNFLDTARRIGVLGFIYALTHVSLTLFVLTDVYKKDWLGQQAVSLTAAKISVFLFLLVFLSFISHISSRLGEKRWLLMQILGYLGFFAILLHISFLIKPSYYSMGKEIITGFHQIEIAAILIFLSAVILLRIILSFINKRISLQTKTILHTFIFLAVGALTIGSYIILSDLSSHKEDAFDHNNHMASFISTEINNNPNQNLQSFYQQADELTSSANGSPTIFFINNNKEIIHYPGKKKEGITYTAFDGKKPVMDSTHWEVEYSDNGHTVLDTITDLGSNNGYLVASTDFTNAEMGHFGKEIIYSIFIILFVTFITGVMTLFFTRKNILEPVKRITDASKKISGGELNTKIAVKSNDEFATLARVFNEMAEKLQKQIDDLKKLDKLKNEFIAIASHNLRTPLTTLRGYLDTLTLPGAGKLSVKQTEVLQKAQRSATSLASLTEGLLDITSLETEGVKIVKNPVNLTDIVKSVINDLAVSAKEKDIKVVNKLGEEEIMTIGDELKLKQALLGVYDNAIKFNKKGGEIVLEKIVDDTEQNHIGRKEVIITITDTGIGIAKNEKENIFKKFNRGTSTYTYEYEGVGLGLYLTRLIIMAHHGRIWFESEEGKGTTFYISLPAK